MKAETPIRMTIYSRVILAIAVLAWLYCLSWTFAMNLWRFAFNDVLHLNPNAMSFFFNTSLMILMIVCVAATIAHIVILILPKLRRSVAPRWYSHMAACALAWLAIGSTIIILN